MSPQALYTDLDSVLLIDMDRTVTALDKTNGLSNLFTFLTKRGFFMAVINDIVLCY
jgi:hypothetical protein